MVERFLPREQFDSYEDFKQNYRLQIPEDFNFAYDVIDQWAAQQFDKPALVRVAQDLDRVERLSFGQLMERSCQAANYFAAHGVQKGDFVLLILRQRVEAWICMLALHRIGAVVIPATFQLMPHDIEYRCNKAGIKMICCVDDAELLANIQQVRPQCPTLKYVAVVGDQIPEGCEDFRAQVAAYPKSFPRPTGAAATIQIGTVTTGDPGSDAAVTNSGTEQDAVLNFTIPRGDSGSSASPVLLSAYSTPPQSGTSGAALLFDRNGLSYGSAISHTAGSGTFTINTPGVYSVTFHGAIAPASGVNFPLSIAVTLQQGGAAVPGGTVLHTFHTSSDVANVSLAVPVEVSSAPSALEIEGTGGSFLYSAIAMTITRLGDIPSAS